MNTCNKFKINTMKNLIFTILFCLPNLAIAQKPQQFSEKEKPVQGQKHESKIRNAGKISQLKEKFQTPFDMNEHLVLAEEEFLKSGNFKFLQNREIQLQFREKMLKSAQEDVSLMDSIYGYSFASQDDSVLTIKIFMEYTNSAKRWCIWRSELDTTNMQWVNIYRQESFSDNTGNDTLGINYEWSTEINDWMPEQKTVQQIDNQGRRILLARFQWHNLSQKWRGVEKLETAYDDWGNQTLYAFYNGWNDVMSNWIGYIKEEYEYDKSGNLNYISLYQWNAATRDWIGSYKLEMERDEWGNLTLEELSMWDVAAEKWTYHIKLETSYDENGLVVSAAYYFWDPFYERWVGYSRYEIFRGNDWSEVLVNYSWNIGDETWEAGSKSVSEWNADGTYIKTIQYNAKDSVIQTELINGFNSDTTITKIWITPSCPDQTCTALDSDYVEGNASILWDYNINGNLYTTGGFCQIDIENHLDLSKTPAIAFNYKVLEPSPASFIILFTETNGETWMVETQESLSDTTGNWLLLHVPLTEVNTLVKQVDGYFDFGTIKSFQIKLHVPKGIKTSGTVLIDNFTACNIKKSENWIPGNKAEEWYDEKGNFIAADSSRWDPLTKEFIHYYQYKSDLTYDDNGNILSNNSYEWNEIPGDSIWVNKYEGEYNENNKQTRSESYSWDVDAGIWVGNQKQETAYDEFGNIIQFTNYQWNFFISDWLPLNKFEYTWNEAGIQTSEAYYSWSLEQGQLVGNYRNETFFNEFGEEIKTIFYNWNLDLNNWKIHDVNLTSHFNTITNPQGEITGYEQTQWDETLKRWRPIERYYYFYSFHSITAVKPETADFINKIALVYPNPASTVIYIQLNPGIFSGTAGLFNDKGQLLKKVNLTTNLTSIQVNELPKGIYILYIETNQLTESKKVLIQ